MRGGAPSGATASPTLSGRRLRANIRGATPWGAIGGVALILVGLYVLASTGGFAYFGIAGTINTTFLYYAIYNLFGVAAIIGGVLVAWRL